jgi:hypothetical protein
MNRDFFDNDLVKPREEISRVKLGPADEPDTSSDLGTGGGFSRGSPDLNLPLLASQRKRIELQTARTAEELERLRRQTEALEREKRDLEDRRKKQDDYEKGKQELLDGLNQSLVTLERDEIKTQQLAELLQSVRQRFRGILAEISAINENDWPAEQVREELGKALVRVDDARMEYNKAMARVKSVISAAESSETAGPMLFTPPPSERHEGNPFVESLKTGLAFTLPLLIMIALLCAVLVWKSLGA